MAALTLIDGEAQRTYEYEEHPLEVARRALIAAAELEQDPLLARALERVASTLPRRSGRTVGA